MIIHPDWQVRNSQRKYPIDERCSAVSDSGVALPESVLVDANIWAPAIDIGGGTLKYIYVSSINVSAHLVSVTFLGCTEQLSGAATDFVPLGVIALQRPVEPHKNYPIEPLLDGVMGWVSFGHFVAGDEAFSASFSSPNQSMLVPKAARFYDTLPVAGVGVENNSTRLTGDVLINAASPFVAEVKAMRLQGEETDRQMLVIGLEQTEDTMAAFAGECGKRAETNNCRGNAITSIAGATPDCTGNINIEFSPEIIVRNFLNPLYPIDPLLVRGGICLDSVYALDQACNKTQTLPDDSGFLPADYAWARPCDLTLPFVESSFDVDSFTRLQLLKGYAYTEAYDCYLTPGLLSGAELAPCFNSVGLIADTLTERTHTVMFSAADAGTPLGCTVGMFVCDTINTRVLVFISRYSASSESPYLGRWTIAKFSKSLDTVDEVLASGEWGDNAIREIAVTVRSDLTISVAASGGTSFSTTVEFEDDDEYFDPTGLAGVYVGSGTVILDSYSVVDA